jgi:hypothetical protein
MYSVYNSQAFFSGKAEGTGKLISILAVLTRAAVDLEKDPFSWVEGRKRETICYRFRKAGENFGTLGPNKKEN